MLIGTAERSPGRNWETNSKNEMYRGGPVIRTLQKEGGVILLGDYFLGQRRCTSPEAVIVATKGGSTRRAMETILGSACSRAWAISAPDRFPETKTNSLTLCFARACFSRMLYRILLSAVRSDHSFLPTSGSQTWSGVPRAKWARWRSCLTPTRESMARMALALHRFSSR